MKAKKPRPPRKPQPAELYARKLIRDLTLARLWCEVLTRAKHVSEVAQYLPRELNLQIAEKLEKKVIRFREETDRLIFTLRNPPPPDTKPVTKQLLLPQSDRAQQACQLAVARHGFLHQGKVPGGSEAREHPEEPTKPPIGPRRVNAMNAVDLTGADKLDVLLSGDEEIAAAWICADGEVRYLLMDGRTSIPAEDYRNLALTAIARGIKNIDDYSEKLVDAVRSK